MGGETDRKRRFAFENAKLGFGGAVVVKDESFSELQQSDVAVKRAAGIKKVVFACRIISPRSF